MPLAKILIPDFLLAQISATNFRRLKQQQAPQIRTLGV
ncbi:hypothetical protein COO91_05780 [Nostoc flagelliforme CCNUN1]|uniref:Uncharacterized protein n=1 Tax=Nostoc flagelliforme CCNUN1 TaxID=2038116 RepID=A0A2K8SWH3_9NOSO|nr:hypothetical protein COO91_05780 [Nostoc flagelliforme CCNUN1]